MRCTIDCLKGIAYTYMKKNRESRLKNAFFLTLKLDNNKLTEKAAILAEFQDRKMRAGGWTLTKACGHCWRAGRGLNLGEYTRGWLPE